MELRCKASKRFLLEINIEEYYNNLKNIGVDITFPIKIKIPCGKCRMVEEYEIYPTHYNHIKSYKHSNWQLIKKYDIIKMLDKCKKCVETLESIELEITLCFFYWEGGIKW